MKASVSAPSNSIVVHDSDSAPSVDYFILLEDGVSFLLQEDGTSKFVLE